MGFREDVRHWLDTNCPAGMRCPAAGDGDICWGGRTFEFQSEAQKLWLVRMSARGWTVPTWPTAYGGGGLSQAEADILQEEMDRIGARPPLVSFGISMLGPALLHFGTEAQKREHLPRIARGEIRWCQGYSEPGAGSDLASLSTRAEDRGDTFLVNGQKIWTSYADRADWIFCLVRTDPAARKQMGISFLLIDMATPGITTRPIRLISGQSPFCETFFSDVVVPKHQVVGTLHRGWDVAKYLLTHEREMIGRGGSGLFDSTTLNTAAREAAATSGNRLADTMLRTQIARTAIDTFAFDETRRRYAELMARGEELGARSAVLKFYGTELNKRRQDLLMSLGGLPGLVWQSGMDGADGLSRQWLRSKGNSIEGGTSEIMLEIIARQLLELPRQ